MTAKELLIKLFQLPQDEIIFQDYGCAFQKGVLKHGRMFVGENHICFYANILSTKTKINDIILIEKKKVLGLIENAIEIQTKDQKSFYFCSFNDRDSVFQLLSALWKGQPADFQPEQESSLPLSETSTSILGEHPIENAEVDISFLQADSNADQKQELVKAIFPVSVDKFFELFIGDEAVFSLIDHRKNRQDFEMNLSKWMQAEDGVGFTRELNAVIKVQDVPFKDRSRLYKLQNYKRENSTIIIGSMSKTLDVPYSNSFQIEEQWELSAIENEPNKCQLRIFGSVVFLKSTMMKKTIQSRSIQGLKEDYEIYLGGMRKKIESLQTKSHTPQVEGAKQHEYEESKSMETMIKTRSSSSDSIKVVVEKQNQDFKQKLIEFGKNLMENQKDGSPLNYRMQQIIILLLLFIIMIILIVNNSVSQRLRIIEEFIVANYAKNHDQNKTEL